MTDKRSKFHVDVLSDTDYDNLLADIFYDNKFVARLEQESECFKMEVAPIDSSAKFPLRNFLEAIEYAKKRLWELRRDDQQHLKLEDYQ